MRTRQLVPFASGLLVMLSLCGCYFYSDIYLENGCWNEAFDYWECCDKNTPPDHPTCLDAGADADTDAGEEGVDAGADASDDDGGETDAGNAVPDQPSALVCPWSCTPAAGGGFDAFPSYVWLGEEDVWEPEPLGELKATSWVDVEFAEPNCPACSCVAPEDAEDGCVMPSAVTARSTSCQDNSSSTSTSFDPPANWAGTCTAANPVVADAMCDGAPCVKSLVLQPPTLAPCVAEPAMPNEGQPVPSPKRTKATSYVAGKQDGMCMGSSANCIKPAPDGFRFCLVAYGRAAGEPCPNDWSERHTGWKKVEDARRCSACSCGAPQDGSCYVRATVFADDVCSDDFADIVVASFDEPACLDVPTGSPLGSKTAEVLSYVAGSCSPTTSMIVGEQLTGLAVTFCCGPNPEKQD